MAMILDPPVTPYSPPAEIRRWLEHLRARLEEEQEPENRDTLREAIGDAEQMLELQRNRNA